MVNSDISNPMISWAAEVTEPHTIISNSLNERIQICFLTHVILTRLPGLRVKLVIKLPHWSLTSVRCAKFNLALTRRGTQDFLANRNTTIHLMLTIINDKLVTSGLKK